MRSSPREDDLAVGVDVDGSWSLDPGDVQVVVQGSVVNGEKRGIY